MVIAHQRRSASSASHFARLPGYLDFFRLIHGIAVLPGVSRIACVPGPRDVAVWVLLTTDDRDTADRVYDLEAEYLTSADPLPIELEIVPLDKIDPTDLPPATTVFER